MGIQDREEGEVVGKTNRICRAMTVICSIVATMLNIASVADTGCPGRRLASVDGIEWKYSVVDGRGVVRGGRFESAVPRETAGRLRVPQEIGGMPILQVGTDAFSGCSNLVSVVVEDGILGVSARAFRNCTRLETVDLPASIRSIGPGAFLDCSSIVAIELPPAVDVVRPKTFLGCRGLRTIKLPSALRRIDDGAFSQCMSLDSLEIPSGVTNIGHGAFAGCRSLRSLDIHSAVRSIGDYAFSGCSSLMSLGLPHGVTNIGAGAFLNCDSLRELRLPLDLEHIGEDSLRNCSSLTNIWMPRKLVSVGRGSLTGCPSLRRIMVEHGNPVFSVKGNFLVTNHASVAVASFGCESRIFVPQGVRSIARGALDNLNEVREIFLPRSVVDVPGDVFASCPFLTNIVVDTDNPRYSSRGGALYSKDGTVLHAWPRGVKNAILPHGVRKLHRLAFANCSELVAVELPQTLTEIEGWCFLDCGSLSEIQIPPLVHRIGPYAFSGNTSLTAVKLPLPLKVIQEGTFLDCTSLRDVAMQCEVSEIERLAFGGCSSLQRITLPASVKRLSGGMSPFDRCSSLKLLSFLGDAPFVEAPSALFCGCPDDLVVEVGVATRGWEAWLSGWGFASERILRAR